MLTFLWIASIILAFAFPAFLVDAIREQDENKAYKARFFACIAFGVIVLAITVIVAYS